MNRLVALTVPCILTFAALGQEAAKPQDTKDKQPPTKIERTDKPAGAEKNQDKAKDKAAVDKPGAEHKNLAAFIGTWQATGQCLLDASQPEPVTGTSSSQWVLGERFVQTNVRSTNRGQAVEGIGMMGYDNTQKKYTATWQDSMCTSIKMETGDYDAASKTFTFKGESKDKDGKSVQCRRTVKVNSETEHVMTTYIAENGQPERKIAELTLKRTSERTGR